ncbi:uncharacterized protein DUF4367 [Bacillus oleivorans]|uniref:Uncharacterized protein DUF4367 n=1 Tax=Bacillus oleivorans TaxID=1448271 RepID=A0A285CNZ0_9BACI|nr:DUF4367 domain-containing protein [Bacillus oleivorans]SNX68768.1 uncharacterized protein DUF4367 [Bacillus oleivorans]
MKEQKHDLRYKFKSEADQALFQSIDFTSKMKEDIRREIDSKKRRWNHPISFLAAAAILCFSLLTFSYFTMSDHAKPENNPKPEEPNTLIGNEDEDILNPIAGPERETQELNSPEEAKEVLGEAILLPAYIPKGYSLEHVQTLGEKKVIMTYLSGDQSYLIIIENAENQQPFVNYEKVQIQNTTGYLYETEYDSELHFYADGFHYMISGLISKEEVIKVAEGLQ